MSGHQIRLVKVSWRDYALNFIDVAMGENKRVSWNGREVSPLMKFHWHNYLIFSLDICANKILH
jgi:hypothetical protein